MEDQLLKRRLSTPRAATVVVLAAAVAVSVTVVPSVAQSFLTSQKAAKVYVSNKKASTLYLKKKAASNLYVAKATAPKPPVVGDRRRHRPVRARLGDHRRATSRPRSPRSRPRPKSARR